MSGGRFSHEAQCRSRCRDGEVGLWSRDSYAMCRVHYGHAYAGMYWSAQCNKIVALRDTGCSSVVVRTELVQDAQFTGNTQTCLLIDRTIRKVPVAEMQVCSPYFTGDVKALCMDNPLYDLIIGNVPGARNPGDVQLSRTGEPENMVVTETAEEGAPLHGNRLDDVTGEPATSNEHVRSRPYSVPQSLRETMGAFIITFLARNDFRNDFQGDLGDDKRKAVQIRGLETPFRDAAFITTFSGVELRFPNDFQGDFCRL